MKKRLGVLLLFIICLSLLTWSFFYLKEKRQQQAENFASINFYKEANEELLKKPFDSTRVVFVGNSITQHWISFDPVFFETNDYINRGIQAETMPQILGRFQNDVINLHPSIVVIGGGINDIAENSGPYNEDYTVNTIAKMVELVQGHGTKVILTSVLPAKKFDWNPKIENVPEKIEALNERIKAYADVNNIPYVDYHSHLVNEERVLNPKYAVDWVHPNKEGYLIMEPLVQAAIDSLRDL